MLQTRPLTEVETPVLDFAKLRAATMVSKPFVHLIVADSIQPEWRDKLIDDFPAIKSGGSFPVPALKVGEHFSQLLNELNSAEFKAIVEKKFSLHLGGHPTLFTVRGRSRPKDGKIHTDAESKIVTVLLYMNRSWGASTGRLRILNSRNIEDVAAEILPTMGALLIFQRSDHSFHGHLPFVGERRVIQMNWVTEQKYVDREIRRHRWSAIFKTLGY